MGDFDVVGPKAIRDGVATNACFERTETALRHAGKSLHVVAEMTVGQFPDGNFELFASIKGAAELLTDRDIDVNAIPGDALLDGDPVVRIKGGYPEFVRLETSLSGFFSYVSDCAAAAPEARSVVSDSTVFSFDARHVRPAITTMVKRNVLVADLDSSPHVATGKILKKEASGTVPHALPVASRRGNQARALRAFNETVDEDVPRVALCDAYGDETEEVLRTVGALGGDLGSVRLDTTSSYRGDLRHIIHEVRQEFGVRDHKDVGIFVSGGLGPAEFRHLRDVVEGFDVDGHTSNVDPVNSALNIIKISGGLAAKWGRLLGVRKVYRTTDGDHHIGLHGRPSSTDGELSLKPLIRDGEVVSESDFDIDVAATQASESTEPAGLDRVSRE